jgi:hypothetical protein
MFTSPTTAITSVYGHYENNDRGDENNEYDSESCDVSDDDEDRGKKVKEPTKAMMPLHALKNSKRSHRKEAGLQRFLQIHNLNLK